MNGATATGDAMSRKLPMASVHKSPNDRVTAQVNAELVAAIGGPVFPSRLLDALRALAGVELCSVFQRVGLERVDLIFADGELPGFPEFTLRASHAYARSFWRSDRQLFRLARSSGREPILVRRRAAEIADPDYRATCYDRAQVAERVSVLSPGAPNLVINGYRTANNAPFAPHDVERLELHAALLIAALRQHLRAVAPVQRSDETTLTGRLAALDCGLSAREAEIAAALIMGETQDGIAKAKRLSHATVVTYRRRAYGKLGVNNRRDLIALHRQLATDNGRMPTGREGE